MEKSDVLYERIDHLLAISLGQSDSLCVTTENVLVVKFSDYVKSQLHQNMVKLFNRSIFDYKKALDYIEGDTRKEKQAAKVLSFFYLDMLNFLKHNKHNVRLELLTDVNFPSKRRTVYTYNTHKQWLEALATCKIETFEEALNYVEQHPEISNIIDYFTDKESILDRLDSFCIMNILENYKTGKILEWEVPNGI